MKVNSFYGFKKEQFRTFSDKGKYLVVTKLKTAPIVVKRVKSPEKDGYQAYQVEVKGDVKTFLREIKAGEESKLKVGEQIKIDEVFKVGDLVKVSGASKGKGFAGGMKRWGFKGGPRTHGQSDRERAPGSIGQGTDPGRVWKGKKMPGRMGGVTKTIKGLKVFKIDSQNNEVWLTGLVPGGKEGLIKISK